MDFFRRNRSFFVATLLALALQIAAIFVFRIASTGMDCGILEQRLCSWPVFLRGIADLVASINIYTLGIPTIIMAVLIGGAWRMYRQLRQDGMKHADFLREH